MREVDFVDASQLWDDQIHSVEGNRVVGEVDGFEVLDFLQNVGDGVD